MDLDFIFNINVELLGIFVLILAVSIFFLSVLGGLFKKGQNRKLNFLSLLMIFGLVFSLQSTGDLDFAEEFLIEFIEDTRFSAGEQFASFDPEETNQKLNEASEYFYDNQTSGIIKISSHSEGRNSTGTGFPISEDEDYIYVLTNHHVIFDSSNHSKDDIKLEIMGEEIGTNVIKTNERRDLTLLEVDKNKLEKTPYIFNIEKDFQQGDPVFTAGYPSGDFRLARGVVVRSVSTVDKNYFEARLEITNGASGSPVLNTENNYIGIIFAGRAPEEGQEFSEYAYFMSSEKIIDFVSDKD